MQADRVLVLVHLDLLDRSREITTWEALTHPNRALWWIVGGAIAALLAALYWPPAREVFRFEALGAGELALAAAGLVSPLWCDGLKLARRAVERP